MKTDPELLDFNQTPCAAYVSFEEEEGYNRALNLNESVKERVVPSFFDHLLTEKLEITDAPEPTDIIWENRHFSDNQRRQKALIVGLVIAFLLLISALNIFNFTIKGKTLKEKYPKTDCIEITAVYKSRGVDVWQKAAFHEYLYNKEQDENDLTVHFTDVLQCFCRS